MDEKALEHLLNKVKEGNISVKDALKSLKGFPYERIDQILFDHHRLLRKGVPEIIFGPRKTRDQLLRLARRFVADKIPFLITRLEGDKADFLRRKVEGLKYSSLARCLSYFPSKLKDETLVKGVLIITAGTADLPVAQEALECLRISGIFSRILPDVGVAGIHRLFDNLELIFEAKVIIAVAGMEGALPSIIAGISSAPVIAVPTSTGYGTNFGGVTPLLAMLNTCAPGIGVVNIDNGVGAALLAASILNMIRKNQEPVR